MYRIKRFSKPFTISAGLGLAGLASGAYLGNRIQGKIEGYRAMKNYNPSKEAEKLDISSEKIRKNINDLKSNKEYLRRLDKAIKEREKKYKIAERNWDESLMDKADEEFSKAVPEGNVYDMEETYSSNKSKASDIRQNPDKYRNKAKKDAESYRFKNPGEVGSKVGAAVGGIGGALLGAKISSR
jgi:Ribonuclease G/E